MRHLSSEELLDIADGTTPASNPHLAACETCRIELEEVRATLAEVRRVDVPEPSPLFWDHFSSRVRSSIEVDANGQSVGRPLPWWSWRFLVPIASVAMLALVAALGTLSLSNRNGQSPSATPSPSGSTTASLSATSDDAASIALEQSPSFDVVADLTTDVDLDTVQEAGLVESGTADHAVTHMNDDELRELARLLRDEIAREQRS